MNRKIHKQIQSPVFADNSIALKINIVYTQMYLCILHTDLTWIDGQINREIVKYVKKMEGKIRKYLDSEVDCKQICKEYEFFHLTKMYIKSAYYLL